MDRRLILHEKLLEIIGNGNVYFQRPGKPRMEYPCIKYKKARPRTNHADDMRYFNKDHYELIVISDDPDTDIPDRILEEFKFCSINTYYSADNLTHCSMDLYF